MKRGNISLIILWICLVVSVVVFCRFLWTGVFNPLEEDIAKKTNGILIWIYVLFGLTSFTVICFTFKQIAAILSRKPQSAIKRILPIVGFGLTLFLAYILGSSDSLNMLQYDGNENTHFWLKLTDMWLYSIYFLLGLTVFSILFGIIWSYLKSK